MLDSSHLSGEVFVMPPAKKSAAKKAPAKPAAKAKAKTASKKKK
jgi:hypothetical protein